MEVSRTILSQLGGNRFIAMTGAKNFVGGPNWLSMKLPRNHSKANYLKITLNAGDLYDIIFMKYRKPSMRIKGDKCYLIKETEEVIAEYKDIFCDQLQEIFTEVTWLYTHL